VVDRIDQSLHGFVRPLPHITRDLGHPVDEKVASGVQDGAIVGRAAVVHTDDDPSVRTRHFDPPHYGICVL